MKQDAYQSSDAEFFSTIEQENGDGMSAIEDYKPYDEIILLRKVLQDTREHRDRLNDQCAQLRVELEEALDLLWACSKHNDYVGRKTLMEAIDDYLSAHRPTSPKKSLGETL